MTTTTAQVHDRQATAFILLARLGFKYQWTPLLMQWSLDRHEGLHGIGGPALIPFVKGGRRPFYLVAAIEDFIERALKTDPDLGPATTIKPATVELDCEWMDSRIHWRTRKIRRSTSATKKGPSWAA